MLRKQQRKVARASPRAIWDSGTKTNFQARILTLMCYLRTGNRDRWCCRGPLVNYRPLRIRMLTMMRRMILIIPPQGVHIRRNLLSASDLVRARGKLRALAFQDEALMLLPSTPATNPDCADKENIGGMNAALHCARRRNVRGPEARATTLLTP